MKDKKIISILMSLTMIFVLLGGTLAYVVWGSDEANRTNVVFDIKEGYSCAADGGGDITSNDAFIAPASCTNEKYAIKREVTVSPRITEKGILVEMDLWLDINDIGIGLSESENFRYALTTSNVSCDGSDGEVIVSGNFNGKQVGDSVLLLEKKVYNKTVNDKYYLYVWLDSEEKSVSTQNQTFSLSLGGSCSKLGAIESPVLDEGMIPVKISDNGIVTTISKDDSNWYDYYNKEWANMVLVDDSDTTTASGEVFDLSGNGNNATYVGAPVYSEQGLVLDGSDDGIFLGNILQDLFKKSNTIQMKVKRNQTGVRDIFIGNYSVSNNINYEVTTGNQYRGYINNGAADLSIGSVKYNEYILYTFIFNKENNKIDVYENSLLVASGSSTQIGSYSYNFTSAYIGRDSRTGATALNGIIERVMVYSDILTEDEISQNVETNFGEIGTENGVVEDNLLLYYDFRNTYRSIDVREHYLNNSGEIISPANILAYYVWIPRYKYKIWTTGVSSVGQEQSIDIEFESRYDDMSLGTKVGEYRTHPAFWWDHDNDSEYDEGEMLPGIWVGKFETTGSATTPTVKPNSAALTNQTVSAQFNTSLLFAGGSMDTSTGKVTFTGNNTYGLTDKTNSHMMKNSEWGAAAYLSHSQYGIGEAISTNNNSSYITGAGSGTLYGNPSVSDYTYQQSTTGNISGIFDMSGGAWDYVMGNYNKTTQNSGFIIYPEKKYYDNYTVTSFEECTIEECGGHALYETISWASEFKYFVGGDGTGSKWFLRGGCQANHVNTTIFETGRHDGGADVYYGFRSVLIPKMNYTVNFDVNGGDEWIDISYISAGENEFVVPYGGEYKLEVWGAQGGYGIQSGSYTSATGGYGGYSVGMINLSKNETLFVNVGGQGGNGGVNVNAAGGYNGGGASWWDNNDDESSGGGGGATHVALSSGLLNTFENNQNDILIVAGGGGGGAWTNFGGAGGGFEGSIVYNDANSQGTQNSGYAFGLGGDGTKRTGTPGGGGGGGYYGGKGGQATDTQSGSGGSGYIGNSLLTNKYMYCYNCKTSSEEATKTYTTTNVSAEPISNYSKSGNGAARISYVPFKEIMYMSIYGEMPEPTREGYEFDGWYTEIDGGTKVTEDTIFETLSDHTLYAHWKKYPILIFDENSGELDKSYSSTYVFNTVGEHEFVVPIKGKYQLEVWGAQGGSYNSEFYGGYGGYSVGIIELSDAQRLYINVGGKGNDSMPNMISTFYGGYNGGGNGFVSRTSTAPSVGGGGGATHIATTKGILSTLSQYAGNNDSPILIVAGGGGGSYSDNDTYGYNMYGGSGGGYIGNYGLQTGSCKNNCKKFQYPSGGTQTSGGIGITNYSTGATSNTSYVGSFGKGGTGADSYGGGGGGYYGGGSGQWQGGGGGSGYIGNNLLTNKYMYCYNCVTSGEEATKTYTTTNVSAEAISNYAKSGDGEVRITLLKNIKKLSYGDVYGELPIPTREGYEFVGWYTSKTGGVKVSENTVATEYGDINLYAHWMPCTMNINYSVNGGVIKSNTTSFDGSNTYNWTTSNNLVYLNDDLYTSNLSGSETINLPNYNDSNFMNISKDRYAALENEEWVCLSGCKKENLTFDQNLEYRLVDFCDDSQSVCNIVLGVNFVETYVVTYDANGGLNVPQSQIKYYSVPLNLSIGIPNRDNYAFLGWSTDRDAISPTYKPGDEYTINEDITLYALWTEFSPLTSYKCANKSSGSAPYHLQYTGNCEMIDDGDGNWRVKFLNDGTLTAVGSVNIDVFLVGGGGAGGGRNLGGGGGGGYTHTERKVVLDYEGTSVVIGAGGGSVGGSSSYGSLSVAGGKAGTAGNPSPGGDGGSGGGGSQWGAGGSDGGDGGGGSGGTPGKGQGFTTREFGEANGTLYAGGGGAGGYQGSSGGAGGDGGGGRGASYSGSGGNGKANTGGGGGGAGYSDWDTDGGGAGKGGSGIVVIRNARVSVEQ